MTACLVALFFLCNQPVSSSLQELKVDGVIQHQKVLDYYLTLSGTVMPQQPSGAEVEFPLKIQFAFKGSECALFWTDRIKGTVQKEEPAESIHAWNSKYFFTLSKKEHGSGYSLTNVWLNGPTTQTSKDAMKYTIFMRLAITFLSPCYIVDKPLLQWLKTPGFQIISTQEVVRTGQKKMQLHVSYRNQDTKRNKFSSRDFDAKIILDPHNHWLFEEIELIYFSRTGKILNRLKRSIEYDRSRKYPIPIRITVFSPEPYPDGVFQIQTSYAISDIHVVDSEERFKLTAFGFQEPFGVTWERPTPWFLWATGMGFALLIVGYLFKRFARRTVTA